MRILYCHQHFSTPKGSTGIRSYAMAQQAITKGHEVTMVCGSYHGGSTGISGPFSNGKRQAFVDGINVIEFDLGYSNSDGLLRRSLTFCKFAVKSVILALTYNYDLVFATSTPLTAGIPGIFARWLRGKPFIFEVRDLWPELPKTMGVIKNPFILWTLALLEWCSYRSAHLCIGLSPGIVEGIVASGVNKQKVVLIPNGCDLNIFANKNDVIENVQKNQLNGISDSNLVAVYAGTHGLANGLDAVLHTAVVLKNRDRRDIKLVLIGQGKLKPSLELRAKNLGLDNIIFHKPVNKEALVKIMSESDVGMQLLANIPSFYYGTSPNKFFDYISIGLPVLNNYPGWLAGLIDEYDCGFTVPPDDAEAFADALEQAADNRDALRLKGCNARDLAVSDFDREKLSHTWVCVLEGLLEKSKSI